jgi:hypothetical protein
MSRINGTIVYIAQLDNEPNPDTGSSGLAAYAMVVKYGTAEEPTTTQQLELNQFAYCFRDLECPFLDISNPFYSGVKRHVRLSDDSDPFLMTTTRWTHYPEAMERIREMARELDVNVWSGDAAEPTLRELIERMKKADRWE